MRPNESNDIIRRLKVYVSFRSIFFFDFPISPISAVRHFTSFLSGRSSSNRFVNYSICDSTPKVIKEMSLLALTLQVVCLIGALHAEERIVPQLEERRKSQQHLSLYLIDTYVKICKFKRKNIMQYNSMYINSRYVKSTIAVEGTISNWFLLRSIGKKEKNIEFRSKVINHGHFGHFFTFYLFSLLPRLHKNNNLKFPSFHGAYESRLRRITN